MPAEADSGGSVDIQVATFGEVLAEQPMGIFVGPSLRWAGGVAVTGIE
jgi:hypothetical protein